MKRYLVTGGCGFIGTNLVEYLIQNTEDDITVLDNLSQGKLEYLKKIDGYSDQRIDFLKGDVRDLEDVKRAIQDCNHIIHLAAQADVITSIEEPEEDAEINILGTINLLKNSVEEDIDRFVYASSAAPLGEQEMPIHENKVPEPLSPYGASKLAGEAYCSAYSGSFDLNTVVLRFSNVYGPKSWHKGSVVAKFIKQILKDETPKIYGDGEQTRDFIHTEDIARALHLSANNDIEENFELFQIGTGKETTINDLYSILEKRLQERGIEVPEPKYGEKREGEIYRNYTDIEKARSKLDFEPKTSLEEGIDKTIDWFLKEYEG